MLTTTRRLLTRFTVTCFESYIIQSIILQSISHVKPLTPTRMPQPFPDLPGNSLLTIPRRYFHCGIFFFCFIGMNKKCNRKVQGVPQLQVAKLQPIPDTKQCPVAVT